MIQVSDHMTAEKKINNILYYVMQLGMRRLLLAIQSNLSTMPVLDPFFLREAATSLFSLLKD